MILKTLIISAILVAIFMLAPGIKMLFDKNAKFEVHSCFFDSDDAEGACLGCQVNNPKECVESTTKQNQQTIQ